MSESVKRTCPRCRETMEASLMNFSARDKKGRLDSWCRPCRTEDQVQRYHRKRATNEAQAVF